MSLVIIESPYAGNVQANIDYARRCVRDSLNRGEYPIASHLLYTQRGILDDNNPIERQWGIDAGLEWRKVAEKSVVYVDNGISEGMTYGINTAKSSGVPIEYRRLGEDDPVYVIPTPQPPTVDLKEIIPSQGVSLFFWLSIAFIVTMMAVAAIANIIGLE